MSQAIWKHLRYGLGANGQDWLTEPSTFQHLLPDEPNLFDVSPDYRHIERNHVTGDGEAQRGLRGVKNVELPDLVHEAEGLSGGGAGDGVSASSLNTTLDDIYTACFGAEQTADAGETTDASDAGTGLTVILDAASSLSVGRFALFQGATSGEYQARMINAVSGTDATIITSLKTPQNTDEDAAESAVVYPARTWFPDLDLHDHRHLWFKAQYETYERDLQGCFPSDLEWRLVHGEPLRVALTGLRATDWTKDNSPSNVDYTAPTTGSKIVCQPVYMTLRDNLYLAHDLSIKLGLQVSDRKSSGSAAGHLGRVVTGIVPMISGKLGYGGLTAPLEVGESFIDTRHGTQNYSNYVDHVTIQAGNQPGATAAWYFPYMQIKTMNRNEEDGRFVLDFEAKAIPNTSTVGEPMYFGVM